MNKRPYSKYSQNIRKKNQAKALTMHQRKKEIIKKMNQPKSSQPKKSLNMLKRGTAPWKLMSVLFFTCMVIAILLIPTLIVMPSADGYESQSESSEQTDDQQEVALDESSESNQASADLSVAVMRSESENVETVPLEAYVQGVVASEMPVNEFEPEALKAQALAARTFIVDHLLHQSDSDASDVSDTVQHQVYKNEEELKDLWGSDYETNMSKLEEAVTATAGEIITYEDAPIMPAFFSTSNGRTENSEDYWDNELPYLRSVESPWDEESAKFLDQRTFTVDEVGKQLGVELPQGTAIAIETTRTEGERVEELSLNDQQISGRDVREKLDLQSSDFTIEQKNNHLIFTTRGFGHGIGMSQYGANFMAKDGKSYQDIIEHYYQGVEISTVTDTAPTLVSK